MAQGEKPAFVIKRKLRKVDGAKFEKCGAAWGPVYGGYDWRLDNEVAYEPEKYFYKFFANTPPPDAPADPSAW